MNPLFILFRSEKPLSSSFLPSSEEIALLQSVINGGQPVENTRLFTAFLSLVELLQCLFRRSDRLTMNVKCWSFSGAQVPGGVEGGKIYDTLI